MELAWGLIILPVLLGLLGFVEPCTIGSSLLFIRYIEGRPAGLQAIQVAVFAVTRALFIGSLGAIAAMVGTAFTAAQQAGWVVLGTLYVGIGLLYLSGNAGRMKQSIGLQIERPSGSRGAIALACLFGLNVPACAAPLLAALLAPAALGGARLVEGFVSLAVFGLALSMPLMTAVLWRPARLALDNLTKWSRRAPMVLGLLFVALGGWSIYIAVFVAL